MRLSPSVSTLAAALALLVLPAALPAQTAAPTPAPSRPVGCRGTTSGTPSTGFPRGDGTFVVFPGYPKTETVQPGSPAEKAGFRRGDVVVLQDGRDLVGNPPEQPALAGDTVVFTVLRGTDYIPLTVVLGRWDPPEEAPGVTRVCRPVGS
ncbi:MAG: PDZ domain-containing protein [Longimicrobiaceae bacterium]